MRLKSNFCEQGWGVRLVSGHFKQIASTKRNQIASTKRKPKWGHSMLLTKFLASFFVKGSVGYRC